MLFLDCISNGNRWEDMTSCSSSADYNPQIILHNFIFSCKVRNKLVKIIILILFYLAAKELEYKANLIRVLMLFYWLQIHRLTALWQWLLHFVAM